MQLHGTKYQEGAIVTLASNTLPLFGRILDILVVDVDTVYFVCEMLETEEFCTHLHAFVVSTQKPIPLIVIKQSELVDFHVIGLYKLRLFDQERTTMYVVPNFINNTIIYCCFV